MHKLIGLSLMVMVIAFSGGCGDSPSDTEPDLGNGRIAFTLAWPDSQKESTETLPSVNTLISCDDAGVAVVSCDVYENNGQMLTSSSWPCEQRQGTLSGIPVSQGLSVVLNAKDENENILYRGVRDDVTVVKGQTNDLGVIELAAATNHPPIAQILQPHDAVVFHHGATVTFEGSANDPEDGTVDGAALVWSSDIDGQIGVGTTVVHSNLSAGTHKITLSAIDTEEGQGHAAITLIINAWPVVTISGPENGHNRCFGLPVRFSGSASDPEDGDISDSGTLQWQSDLDGQIGTGNIFSTDTMSHGTHTITLSAADSKGAEATATVQIIVHPPRLSDTGQTLSATSVFGEDSDYTSFLPAFTDNGDGTVTDDLTGLMWQQTDDGTARPHYITVYEYLPTVTLGGYSDWRLPSKKELLRIANYNRENPAINNTLFKDTKNGCYWTQTQCAGQVEYLWSVDGTNGNVMAAQDSSTCYVRLVRGAPDTTTSEFINADQSMVIDQKTGLMWQGGQGSCCSSWTRALTHCEELTLGEHTDWRLPNLKELESLVDDSKNGPAIDTSFYPTTLRRPYWSSTVRSSNTHHMWKVNFDDGEVNHNSVEEEENVVRCVRDTD